MGAATSLFGSLFGMSKSAKAAKKRQQRLDNAQQENEAWYRRNYYADPTKRADAQRLLTMTQEAVRDRNQAAAGRQAVMGGTGESTAADRAANNAMYANAVGTVVAGNEARKDRIDQQYRTTRANIEDKKADAEYQRGQALAQGVQDVGQSIFSLASGLADNYATSKPKQQLKAVNPMEQQNTAWQAQTQEKMANAPLAPFKGTKKPSTF